MLEVSISFKKNYDKWNATWLLWKSVASIATIWVALLKQLSTSVVSMKEPANLKLSPYPVYLQQ